MELRPNDVVQRTPMLAVGGTGFGEVNKIESGLRFKVFDVARCWGDDLNVLETRLTDVRPSTGFSDTTHGETVSLPAQAVDEPFFEKVEQR